MNLTPGTMCEFIESPCTPKAMIGKKCIYDGPVEGLFGLLLVIMSKPGHEACTVTMLFEPGAPQAVTCANSLRPLPPPDDIETTDEASKAKPVTA